MRNNANVWIISHYITPAVCAALWDDVNCWPHAEVGDVISQQCPTFLKVKGWLVMVLNSHSAQLCYYRYGLYIYLYK